MKFRVDIYAVEADGSEQRVESGHVGFIPGDRWDWHGTELAMSHSGIHVHAFYDGDALPSADEVRGILQPDKDPGPLSTELVDRGGGVDDRVILAVAWLVVAVAAAALWWVYR